MNRCTQQCIQCQRRDTEILFTNYSKFHKICTNCSTYIEENLQLECFICTNKIRVVLKFVIEQMNALKSQVFAKCDNEPLMSESKIQQIDKNYQSNNFEIFHSEFNKPSEIFVYQQTIPQTDQGNLVRDSIKTNSVNLPESTKYNERNLPLYSNQKSPERKSNSPLKESRNFEINSYQQEIKSSEKPVISKESNKTFAEDNILAFQEKNKFCSEQEKYPFPEEKKLVYREETKFSPEVKKNYQSINNYQSVNNYHNQEYHSLNPHQNFYHTVSLNVDRQNILCNNCKKNTNKLKKSKICNHFLCKFCFSNSECPACDPGITCKRCRMPYFTSKSCNHKICSNCIKKSPCNECKCFICDSVVPELNLKLCGHYVCNTHLNPYCENCDKCKKGIFYCKTHKESFFVNDNDRKNKYICFTCCSKYFCLQCRYEVNGKKCPHGKFNIPKTLSTSKSPKKSPKP